MVDGLTIELASSSLFGQPVFSSIEFTAPDQMISIETLSLSWDWRCLWHSKVCVEKLDIKALDIVRRVSASGDDASNAKLNLPIPIEISNLNVQRTKISLVELDLELSAISVSLNAQDSAISQLSASVDQITYLHKKQSPARSVPFEIDTFDPTHFGELRLPTLAMSLAIESLKVNRISNKLTPTAGSVVEHLDFSGAIAADSIVIKHLSAMTQHADFSLEGEVENRQFLPHDIKIQASNVNSALLNSDDIITINSTGQLDELNLTAVSSGNINATSHLAIDLIDFDLPFKLSTKWQSVTLPTSQQLKLAQGAIELAGNRHAYTVKGNTDVESPLIPKASLDLFGVGSLTNIDITNSTIETLGGTLAFNATLDWQQALAMDLQLTLQKIKPQLFWPQYHGNISGTLGAKATISDKTWSLTLAQLALTGDWLDRPIELTGRIVGQSNQQLPLGQWLFDNVHVRSGDNKAQLQGEINQNIDLAIAINAPEINQSLPEVSGSVSGNITVTGKTNSPSIYVLLKIKKLVSPGHNLSVISADLTSNFTLSNTVELDKVLPISANLAIEELQFNDTRLQDASVSMTGNAANHQIIIEANALPWQTQIIIAGKHRDKMWHGEVGRAQIASPLKSWKLSQPLLLGVNQQQREISFSAHCWIQSVYQTQLCLREKLTLNANTKSSNPITIDLVDLDLSQFNPRLPPAFNIAGQLSSHIKLQIKPGNKPYIHSETSVNHGVLTLQYMDRTISHPFKKLTSQMIIDQQLSSLNFNAASLNIGEVAITLLTDIYSDKPQLTGHIEVADFNLAPYQALVPQLTNISGFVNASTGFTGDISKPLFFGDVIISETDVLTTFSPTRVTQFNSNLSLLGQHARWNSQFKLGGGNGQFAGEVSWQQQLSAFFEVAGDKLRIARDGDLHFTVSPALTVDITPSLTKIRGELVINDGQIKIDKLPRTAIAISPDVKIRTKEVEQAVPLDLAVEVSIEPALTIEAFGLNADLEGRIKLSQTPDLPLSGFGDLALLEATYQAMGQNLIINKGQLIFTSVLQNPMVNIEAVRDPNDTQDGVTAGLYISGNATAPQLEIFSAPAMPQQQALSYLLRGKGLDAASGGGNSIAISMLLNSGIGQSSKFVGRIGDTFGIDQLSLNTSGSGDSTKLQVSGYLGPKLQLRYGVGLFDGVPEVGLRYQLSHSFFIEFVNDTGQALDVLYKFSFD